MGATTDQLVPVVDPANRAVRLAASVCVWDMQIPTKLLSLYGRVCGSHLRTEVQSVNILGFTWFSKQFYGILRLRHLSFFTRYLAIYPVPVTDRTPVGSRRVQSDQQSVFFGVREETHFA